MCNCRQEMEEKLLEKVKEQKPNAEQLKVELGGYGMMLNGNKMEYRPVMPINIEYLHTFKNGNQKTKKDTMIFALKHCPFCGEEVVVG